jgi:hypothetical protein
MSKGRGRGVSQRFWNKNPPLFLAFLWSCLETSVSKQLSPKNSVGLVQKPAGYRTTLWPTEPELPPDEPEPPPEELSPEELLDSELELPS